jgi:enamine deaminase RidA (YjgF/YER057c/UK114 family)
MTRQTFFPNPQNKPSGFSPAARVGNTVFSAGQVSTDENGNLVGEGDARAQAEQCLKNVEAAISAAGASIDDVVKITTFLVNVEDYSDYAAARLQLFPENGPASSTVIIKALVRPEFLIEIEAIAVVS